MQRTLQHILDLLMDSVGTLLHPSLFQDSLRKIGRTLGRLELERFQKSVGRPHPTSREDVIECLHGLQRPGGWHFTAIEATEDRVAVHVRTCPFGVHAAHSHHYCHMEAAMLTTIAEVAFQDAKISLRRGAGVPPKDCLLTFHLGRAAEISPTDSLVYPVRADSAPDRVNSQATPQPLAKLSRRELQILKLITEGLGDKEIAAQLNLSVRTVENHAARIRQKLQIHGRAGLVRYVLNNKLPDM